jgi:hypothetical protein
VTFPVGESEADADVDGRIDTLDVGADDVMSTAERAGTTPTDRRP